MIKLPLWVHKWMCLTVNLTIYSLLVYKKMCNTKNDWFFLMFEDRCRNVPSLQPHLGIIGASLLPQWLSLGQSRAHWRTWKCARIWTRRYSGENTPTTLSAFDIRPLDPLPYAHMRHLTITCRTSVHACC